MVEDLSVWNNITTKEEVSTAELSYIIDEIHKMMYAREIEELDNLLRDMDVEKTCIDVMIACSRTPFLAREYLPNYVIKHLKGLAKMPINCVEDYCDD